MFREFDTFNVKKISLNQNIQAFNPCRCVNLLMPFAGFASKELLLKAFVDTKY